MSDPNVIIIGAGISGLAAAHFLARQGIGSILIEKSTRTGGLIRTDHREGCVLEAGPDSYLAAKTAVTELAAGLPGLDEQIIGSNDAARRIFVVRDSKLVSMPRGMVMIAPGDWPAALRSPLFSAGTKLRLIRETMSLETIFRARRRADDFSVGEFVEDHFGSGVLKYVAEPLLAGVYGGDSANLSAPGVLPRFVEYEQKYGSLIRGVRRERRHKPQDGSLFRSFRDGMQTLTDALARNATVYHAEAERIERQGNRWRVYCGQEWLDADDIVLACPAHAAARLLEESSLTLADELASIPYASAILVTMVWERSKVAHTFDGFGFLVPKAERETIAAATWVGTKFPSRIPRDLAAVRAFIVAQDAIRLRDAPRDQVIELVRLELGRFMGIDASPRFATVHSWPESMPQYVVGHRSRVRKIQAALEELSGVHLIGNAYDGVGIPDCVRLAKQTAKEIHARRSPAVAVATLEDLES